MFLRFAIEQAAPRELGSTDEETLVLSYVETLRKDRADLSASDMRRAASLAAVEALGEDGVPREIDLGVLRGILKREASDQPSISAVDNKDIPLGEVLSALISSGILTELRLCDLVRFTYDPVAEIFETMEGEAPGERGARTISVQNAHRRPKNKRTYGIAAAKS